MKIAVEIKFPTWMRKASFVALPLLAIGIGGVAAASVPNTFASGQTLTAADLNENFDDLDGRVTVLEQPASAVLAHKTSSQLVPANSQAAVTFGFEDFDAGDEFDAPTGTFTAARDGYYHVDCNVLFNNSNSGCIVLEVRKGAEGVTQNVSCGPVGAQSVVTSTLVELAAAETIRCFVHNQLPTDETLGGSLNFEVARNSISVFRVR